MKLAKTMSIDQNLMIAVVKYCDARKMSFSDGVAFLLKQGFKKIESDINEKEKNNKR